MVSAQRKPPHYLSWKEIQGQRMTQTGIQQFSSVHMGIRLLTDPKLGIDIQ